MERERSPKQITLFPKLTVKLPDGTEVHQEAEGQWGFESTKWKVKNFEEFASLSYFDVAEFEGDVGKSDVPEVLEDVMDMMIEVLHEQWSEEKEQYGAELLSNLQLEEDRSGDGKALRSSYSASPGPYQVFPLSDKKLAAIVYTEQKIADVPAVLSRPLLYVVVDAFPDVKIYDAEIAVDGVDGTGGEQDLERFYGAIQPLLEGIAYDGGFSEEAES